MKQYNTWHKFFISNPQNLKLAALLRSTEKTDESKIVISCHGFAGSKEGQGQALAMAEKLGGLGWNTLLFDFTGCGESEGEWKNISLSGQMEDLKSAVSWCRENDFQQIVLVGRSFGGTTALCHAARDPHIAAVSTWAAVARTTRLFFRRLPPHTNLNGSGSEIINLPSPNGVIPIKKNFFQDLQKHDTLKCAAAISPRPLLVIHGTKDETVPLRDAELIFEAARDPKKIVFIEGADHRFSYHARQLWAEFFDWL